MEETKQQPLALRVCAELAGSFLLCFAIYAFSTWGWLPAWHMPQSPPSSPACPVAS